MDPSVIGDRGMGRRCHRVQRIVRRCHGGQEIGKGKKRGGEIVVY